MSLEFVSNFGFRIWLRPKAALRSLAVQQQPWLSVIIPTYNGAAYLPAALDSLLAQQDRDLEVIAVDDGSTDATRSILACYAKRLPLKVICRQHGGNWVANTNVGMAAATGRYLGFLHQDDLWAPGRLRELKRLSARWPQVRLVLHPAWFIDAAGRRVGLWRCPLTRAARYLRPKEVLERLLVQDFLAVSAPVFRREAAAEVGWMDENLWYTGDWDFWLKLAQGGYTVYHPSPLVSFRIHPYSQTSTRATGSAELRRQYAAVLNRHLSTWRWRCPNRKRLSRIVWFSAEVNLALQRKAVGQQTNWFSLFRLCLSLGPDGWYRYLRDSRITDRICGRLRVGLAGVSNCAEHRTAPPQATQQQTCPNGTEAAVSTAGQCLPH